MKIKNLILPCLLFICFCIIPTFSVSASDFPANSVEKDGYYLDFSDEFNGTELDKSKWTDYYLPNWAEDQESAKANYRLEDGALVEYITENQKPWSPEHDGRVRSSAIMSFDKSWIHNFSGTTDNKERDTWYGYKTKYGYFEMRAKLADCGGGGHQAWWMVGMQQDTDDWFNSKETGEIDILETFFSTPNAWRIASYGWNDPNFQTSWYLSQDDVPSGNPTSEFHLYAMEWSPSSLKFYYDNQLYKVIYDSPDYEMGTILNIYTDAGSGTHNDVWPKEWAIDYLRVWKPTDGYEPTEPGENPEYVIRNRQTGKYMYIDESESNVKYGDITVENELNAKWHKEYKDGHLLLKNVATDEYMNIEEETGFIGYGKVPYTWWSAQWTEEYVDGYIRLVNRWKDKVVIHTEDNLGDVQYGEVPKGYWTSQWDIVQAR